MKKLILLNVFALFGVLANAQYTRTVLLEHFTQASCGPCATYNPAIETLLNDPTNNGKIVAVKYQTAWPGTDPMNAHNPTEVADRVNLYGVSGVPNSVLDGNFYNGHPASWNQGMLDSRAGVPTPFKIELRAIYTGIDSSGVNVIAKIKTGGAASGGFVAHIAVVEDHISFSSPPGSNGERDFYNVMKKMLPSSNGTSIASSWAAGDSVVINESWTHTNVYDKTQLGVVCWVQRTTNDEVMQAAYASVDANVAPFTDFEADHIYISPGTTVNFSDESAFFPTSWNWNFDVANLGGVSPTTSTLKNPSATYSNFGDYTVKLATSNAYGSDSTTKSAYIHVIDCQDVDFDIQLDDYGGTTSWEIIDSVGNVVKEGFGYPNVPGGQLISESMCLGNGCYKFRIHDLAGNGICCVSGNGHYTITNQSIGGTILGQGGQFAFHDSVEFCISTANVAPVAAFGVSNTNICEQNTVQFFDQSANTATTWSWSFPNGTPSTSTLRNPYVQYNSAGTYPVTLRAYNNAGGDTTVVSSFITVNPGPTSFAGADTAFCSNNVGPISLSGSITVASGGTWSTNGSGSFANTNNLNTTYTPSGTDVSNGSVTLSLTTTGNGSCVAANDNMVISFTAAPTVFAGADATICENDSLINVNATVTTATGGTWTSNGSGTFGNANNLQTVYVIDSLDRVAGSVTLTVTTTGNGICSAVNDDVLYTLQKAPLPDAGDDQTICQDVTTVLMDGSFAFANGVRWVTDGTGYFSPVNTIIAPIYIPSQDDINAGSVNLTLITTGNGVCDPGEDIMLLTIDDCWTGINEKFDNLWSVYPNPAVDVINIETYGVDYSTAKVIDVLGQVVKTADSNNQKIQSLDVSDLSNGTYVVELNTKEGAIHKTITIKK